MPKLLSRVAFFAVCLAMLGAGCRSSSNPKNPASTPSPSASSGTAAATAPTSNPREELQKAIAKFQTVKSFRTKVNLSTPQGKLNAVLEFQKPNRFRGTIDMEKTGNAEIIAVDTSLYMRINNQSWMNLSKTPNAKGIGDTLKGALAGDSNLDLVGHDQNLNVTKSRDEAAGCDLYSTTVQSADGKTTYPASVCVKNELPQYLNLDTQQGPIHLDYYDYNEVFLIAKPM